jgi:hypothetical protein
MRFLRPTYGVTLRDKIISEDIHTQFGEDIIIEVETAYIKNTCIQISMTSIILKTYR